MCRFYEMHVNEMHETDSTDAVFMLTQELAKPKSAERELNIIWFQGVIKANDPRMIGVAESDYAAIEQEKYNDWIEDRAAAFRRQIVVVNVAASCPL